MKPSSVRPTLLRLSAQICGAALLLAPAALAQEASTGRFLAFASDGHEARISNFSGLPVPRYSSLKNAPANGRAGPSQDYPVRWQYQVAGLPVVIIRETEDWRKIRDPQGDEVWIHRALLSGDPTAITMYEGAIVREPEETAEVVARYSSGLVVSLDRCEGAWCRVSAGDKKGWAPRRQLWGVEALYPGSP